MCLLGRRYLTWLTLQILILLLKSQGYSQGKQNLTQSSKAYEKNENDI